MAPRLKPIKDEKELAAVPVELPVLVELEPASDSYEADERKDEPEDEGGEETPDRGVSALEKSLQAAQEATRIAEERAAAAERREQDEREEKERLRTSAGTAEKELLNTSLSSAQADEASAQAEFEKAFDAGDAKAMAAAQSKIGRAAARVLQFENAIGEFDEAAKVEKENPRKPAEVDLATRIDRDPNLAPKEKAWLKANQQVLIDPGLNRELDVAYHRAIKAGHVRGTDAYFKFIEKFMGLGQSADADDGDDDNRSERSSIVAAPVSRDSRSPSGRPSTPTRVTLTPEERQIARDMNISDAAYARGKVKLDANKRADPERFAGR